MSSSRRLAFTSARSVTGARFALPGLRRFAEGVLTACGSSSDNARCVTQSLIRAEHEGLSSHGLGRLPTYVDRVRAGVLNPSALPVTVSESGGCLLMDANGGFGHVAAQLAMGSAIELARKHGVGAVAVKNSTHFGVARHWAELAAQEGMIGVALSNAPAVMTPPGGVRPFLGTNPIAIGIPALTSPVIVDLATSVVARGKILEAARAGATIPEGWAVDSKGEPTTSAMAAADGALLPLAGGKGFSLALAIELLTGGLTGGAVARGVGDVFDMTRAQNVSHLLIAIEVARFGSEADFRQRVSALCDVLRREGTRGGLRIRVPGDRRREARAANEVFLPKDLVDLLNELADAVAVRKLRPASRARAN